MAVGILVGIAVGSGVLVEVAVGLGVRVGVFVAVSIGMGVGVLVSVACIWATATCSVASASILVGVTDGSDVEFVSSPGGGTGGILTEGITTGIGVFLALLCSTVFVGAGSLAGDGVEAKVG